MFSNNEPTHPTPVEGAPGCSLTVWDFPVADVLQVGRGVVVADFRAGLELLQPLRGLSRRQLGARLGRDAA